MYRYAERAPEKSKHITSSRPVPDGGPCGDNKHHFHGVTFSRWLLWQIVMTTVTLLARLSEYGLDSGANKKRWTWLRALVRVVPVERGEVWRGRRTVADEIVFGHLVHLLYTPHAFIMRCMYCIMLQFLFKTVAHANPRAPLCMCRVPSWSELDFFFQQETPDTHPGQGVWFFFFALFEAAAEIRRLIRAWTRLLNCLIAEFELRFYILYYLPYDYPNFSFSN